MVKSMLMFDGPTTDPTQAPSWSPEALVAAGLTSSRDAALWLRAAGIDPEAVSDDELPARIQWARDWQEAESRKYGSAPVLMLPLRSGNLAMFALDRQEVRIIEAPELTAEAIAAYSATAEARLKAASAHMAALRSIGAAEPSDRSLARDMRRQRTAPPPSEAIASISLDDL